MTQTETKWSERVKEWKASGQTARSFAQGRDFKPSTLTYWAHRLRQLAGQPSTSTAATEPSARSSPAPRIRMVRVRTRVRRPSPAETTAVTAPHASAMVTIAVGAARIEVRPGFDHALLSEVVDALGGGQ